MANVVKPGAFITFEGGEGAGKSTQVLKLVEALTGLGLSVLRTREPGGSTGAEDIRNLLVTGDPGRWDAMTEALLVMAARRDHVERVIKPALAKGTWVVCDRFSDSTMAYQGYAHGLGRDVIDRLSAVAIDGFKPDLTLILDLPIEEGLARAQGRGGSDGEDRFERMGTVFHERLRQAFLETAKLEPERCHVFDALEDKDTVHSKIMAEVKSRLFLDA